MKKVDLYKCKNAHIVEMLPDSLRVGMQMKTDDGKVLATYQTEVLCPVCVTALLNQLCATAPYVAPEDEKAEEKSEEGSEQKTEEVSESTTTDEA